MRNRAKCKLCNSIIESFHSFDFVQCTCKEIFVDAGEGLRCGAKNWDNFLRVDEEGKEFAPYVKEIAEEPPKKDKPTKEEALEALSELINSYDNLPAEALYAPVNHSDMKTILSVFQFILST